MIGWAFIANAQPTENTSLDFTSFHLFSIFRSFGIAEIKARNAVFTCSAVVNTFATSGSITATSGASFMRAAKRLGLALL